MNTDNVSNSNGLSSILDLNVKSVNSQTPLFKNPLWEQPKFKLTNKHPLKMAILPSASHPFGKL